MILNNSKSIIQIFKADVNYNKNDDAKPDNDIVLPFENGTRIS